MSQLTSASTGDKKFLKIVDGSLREKVPAGTPGAIERKWEAGGKSGVVHELPPYKEIAGKITKVDFFEGEHDGKKFQSLNVEFDKNSEGKSVVISTGADSKYASDLMKKLPNVNFTEDVYLRPFSFVPEGETRAVVGVEVLQKFPGSTEWGKKITSFFHKKEGEKTVSINSFPTPHGDVEMYGTDDWKMFYLGVKKFLIAHTKNVIAPKFAGVEVGAAFKKYAEDEFTSAGTKVPDFSEVDEFGDPLNA